MAKGMDAVLAVGEAKKYVKTGIENGLSIGKGNGPIHHFYDLWKTSDPNVDVYKRQMETRFLENVLLLKLMNI